MVQPRKTRSCLTERFLMGCMNQIKQKPFPNRRPQGWKNRHGKDKYQKISTKEAPPWNGLTSVKTSCVIKGWHSKWIYTIHVSISDEQLWLTPGKGPRPVKVYTCSACGRGFRSKTDIQRHTLIHTGERPYKCEICLKSFRRKHDLERHIFNVHGN